MNLNSTFDIQRIKYATGILLLLILCASISTYFWGFLPITGRNELVIAVKVSYWILVLILFVYAGVVEKGRLLLWKESKLSLKGYLFSVALVFAVVLSVLLILTPLINKFVIHEVSINSAERLSTAVFIFSAFTAAVTEELIFRGFLQPRMQGIFKDYRIAISGSAIIFGLAHVTHGNFFQMIHPFIIGLLFSIYYYKRRSIIVLVICHLIIDLVLI